MDCQGCECNQCTCKLPRKASSVRYATVDELAQASKGKRVTRDSDGRAHVVDESVPARIANLITEDPDVFVEELHDQVFDDPKETYEDMIKHEPKGSEQGWAKPIGKDKKPKVVRGQKHEVEVPFAQDEENIIYHTHPVTGDGPSPIRALPSSADLKVALKDGVTGIGIYNDYYLAKVVRKNGTKSLGNTGHYDKALKEGNFEEAIKCLARLGFAIEIIDSRKNKPVNPTNDDKNIRPYQDRP